MFIRGGSAPRSNPLPFCIPFFTKTVPLSCTSSIDKWCPFHIPCLELCIPFTCCKCTFFLIGIDHKNRRFFSTLWSHKSHLLALWTLLQTQMTDFPSLSYTSTSKIPTLSYTWSLRKIPLSGRASPYRPLLRAPQGISASLQTRLSEFDWALVHTYPFCLKTDVFFYALAHRQ